MKIDLISQRRENVLFLPSNMAAMTSRENALLSAHWSLLRRCLHESLLEDGTCCSQQWSFCDYYKIRPWCLVTLGVSYVQLACFHRWYWCLSVECQRTLGLLDVHVSVAAASLVPLHDASKATSACLPFLVKKQNAHFLWEWNARECFHAASPRGTFS